MYKIGLSTRGKHFSDALFKRYGEGKIEYMELALSKSQYSALDFRRTAQIAEQNGVKIWSIHLPYSPMNEIDMSGEVLAKSTVEFFSELIKKGTDIGVFRYVVHPSSEPVETESRERAKRMARSKQSLAELVDFAATLGATIAVENLPRTCLGHTIAEMEELISAHPALRICLDTNHLLTEYVPDFIRRFGDRIVTTHISDCDFVNERHWLPGEGNNDWGEIYKALCEVNYQGIWLYEVAFACPDTLVRERELEGADFINNANEIFSGREPTLLYTKKNI